jgi:GNAT superfamily N-acetyltransferase
MSSIREFTDEDYPRFTEIQNQVYPELVSERELRYWDETWDKDRYYRSRVVRQDDAGRIVGMGEVRHMPDQFHPDKYGLEIIVDPAARRQGHGGALYDHLRAILAGRGAIAARAWAKESETDSHRFLTNRGFSEARREWQSRLDVDGFDPSPFAGAAARVADQGIELTDLAAERAINENAVTEAYELEQIVSRDVPDIDPYTEVPFDQFLKNVIEAPYSIPEAFLLAKHDGRYVALAWMAGSEEEPDVLYQGLTGVIPEYRGKGIAMALKLATVECARRLGKREIRTWNDTTNQAMLRINEAMGFQKQPAEILYLIDLAAAAAETTGSTTRAAGGGDR